jgi:hypothetical protein
VKQGFTTYTCKLCGDSYVDDVTELASHTYGKWSVEKEATCTDEGIEVCRCTACGATQSRKLEAKGHSYGSWKTTEEPTCTGEGVKQRSCKSCGNTQNKTVEAVGHSYDSGVVVKEAASCKDTGIKRFTCTHCGKSYEAKVMGDHAYYCQTCKQYGSGAVTTLHEDGVECDWEHYVSCKNCYNG